jgi:hypothetical protein
MADDPTAGGIAIFSIDPATGALTQLPGVAGCSTVDGTSAGVPGACTVGGSTFAQPQSVSVSPDGLSVYLPSFAGESLTTLTRETGPVCQGTTASTAYQTPVTVTLSCTDADGDAVTLALASGPTHGSLGPIGPTVTYTPAAGFSGVDSFTFIASDATNASAPTTATIAVGSPPSSLPPSNSRPANVSGVHQTHRTWREGNRLAKISAKRKRPPVGTTFSFTLNETANVTFAFTQRAAGRRVHDRCIAATKLGAKGRKCTRTLIGGTISFIGHPGRNKVAFDGRVNRHRRLKPGTYTLIITAAAPGGHSQPQRITFTIVR